MEKQRYQLSPNIRILSDSESEMAMIYHSLYGNPRIVNLEGLRFLDLFKQPVTAEEISEICDEDPGDIIREFAKIFFLIEPGFNEKEFLCEQKGHHLSNVSAGQTIDRMGLAISDSAISAVLTVSISNHPATVVRRFQSIRSRPSNST